MSLHSEETEVNKKNYGVTKKNWRNLAIRLN